MVVNTVSNNILSAEKVSLADESVMKFSFLHAAKMIKIRINKTESFFNIIQK